MFIYEFNCEYIKKKKKGKIMFKLFNHQTKKISQTHGQSLVTSQNGRRSLSRNVENEECRQEKIYNPINWISMNKT